jgi:hypothetical protein
MANDGWFAAAGSAHLALPVERLPTHQRLTDSHVQKAVGLETNCGCNGLSIQSMNTYEYSRFYVSHGTRFTPSSSGSSGNPASALAVAATSNEMTGCE